MIFAGYTLGGSGGGFIAAGLMPVYGWQVVFLVGGVVPLILAGVLWFALPESIRFLALYPERHEEALRIARQVRPDLLLPADIRLVDDTDVAQHTKPAVADLFEGARAFMTPLLWH